MKHFFLGALLLLSGAAGAQTTTYSADNTTIFPNPERGFSVDRHASTASQGLSLSDMQGTRAAGYTLVRRLYNLQDFRSSAISPAYLDMVKNDISTARAAGIKLVVRFSYNWGGGTDAPKSRILGHLDQLRPVLQANYDAIAHVEVGLIGEYGEWHDSTNGLVNVTDGGDITKRLLTTVPADRMVVLRYPRFKQAVFGSTALAASEAFTKTDRARVGHHNDYFLSDAVDGGTYSTFTTYFTDAATREGFRNYLNQENKYVVQGGESSVNDASLSSCSKSVAELKRLRYSQLNAYWHDGVLARWQSEGCMDQIKRQLGYRFRLVEATLPGSVAAGATLTASLKVKNDGWASCYNARGVEVILRNKTTGAKLVASGGALSGSKDPRFWLTDEEHTVSVSYTVPAGTPTGQYELLLNLPDPLPSLHDRPEYAIRLANPNTWESSTGYNKLGREVTVTAATATPPPPTTSTFSGTYKLVVRSSGKALDVNGGSTADGAKVQQWTNNPSNAQRWILAAVGTDGYYTLTNVASGKKLDLDLNPATNGGYTDVTSNGVHVFQYGTTATDNRLWKIEALSGGYYKLTNKVSGKVLAISGGEQAKADGDPVHQWTFGGGTDQQWQITAVTSAASTSTPAATTSTLPAADEATAFSAYPNPTPDGQATLRLTAKAVQQATVQVFNQQGQFVSLLTVPLTAGQTDFHLPSTLPQGTYHLKTHIDGQPQQFKLKVE